MKFRAALANNDWIVDYNDVIIVLDEKGGASSAAFRSMVSMQADNQRQKCVGRQWNGREKAPAIAVGVANTVVGFSFVTGIVLK